MSKTTPSARSKRHLEKLGWKVGTVERYCHVTKRRHDLFGFIDLVAISPGQIVGLQVTSGSNYGGRVAKVTGECGDSARAWIAAGGVIVVQAWSLRQRRGSKQQTWQDRTVQVIACGDDGKLTATPYQFAAVLA